MSHFMPAPCALCPFKTSVTPFLHPERAYDIAMVASNPYASFPCHKTTEFNDDDEDEYGEAGLVNRHKERECAGMLTMRANELGENSIPEGFVPSYGIVYGDAYDMEGAYEDEWDKS